jgi:hypothetical protein
LGNPQNGSFQVNDTTIAWAIPKMGAFKSMIRP